MAKIKISIVNVVATATVNQEIDFELLRVLKDIFHDSDVYRGCVAYFKSDSMRGKVSIFISGKMISIGTKSESEAFQELDKARDFLFQNGLIQNVILEPIVRNIVATADFQRKIDIEYLSQKLKSVYEPKQFPALILRLNEPFKVSVLIFSSGKTVLSGIVNSEEILKIVNKINELIEGSFK